MSKSTRERIKAKRRKERTRSIIIGGVIAAVAIAGIAWLVNQASARESGEFVEIPQVQAVEEMESRAHVADGSDPGPYNSDPPTSGQMYSSPAVAGFNDAGSVDSFGEFPAGPLMHSQEHGYVIFWYNCDALNESECDDLKDGIKQVMSRVGNFKVIAFPWPSIEEPVVMTSWGRMLRFDEFDADLAEQYVRNFRNQAPEPNAP
ncbi:MAG: hypothetical protein BMS9Abin28_0650 [Anaerolineae bacterium]|nr:MAG: hypothetical protein BMS9Abin28_0650 [Anaerolineae bacterium]